MLTAVWVQAKAAWLKLPPSVRWGTSLFLLARGVLWLWGWAVDTLLPYAPPTVLPDGPLSPALEPLLLPWLRHDVLWFTFIAMQGYAVPVPSSVQVGPVHTPPLTLYSQFAAVQPDGLLL